MFPNYLTFDTSGSRVFFNRTSRVVECFFKAPVLVVKYSVNKKDIAYKNIINNLPRARVDSIYIYGLLNPKRLGNLKN